MATKNNAKRDVMDYEDLCERVIKLHRRGYTVDDIAMRYGMSVTTLPCDKGLIQKIIFDYVKSGKAFDYGELTTLEEFANGKNN